MIIRDVTSGWRSNCHERSRRVCLCTWYSNLGDSNTEYVVLSQTPCEGVCEICHAVLHERNAHLCSWSGPLLGAVSQDSLRVGGHETSSISFGYERSHACFALYRIWHVLCYRHGWPASVQNLFPDHCTAVKNVLMYFRITRNYILVFSSRDLKMPEYNDSDFQADRDSRISTSGSLFSLNGWSVTWRSVRQSCIADSTMLTDYVAACEAAWRLYSFLSSL